MMAKLVVANCILRVGFSLSFRDSLFVGAISDFGVKLKSRELDDGKVMLLYSKPRERARARARYFSSCQVLKDSRRIPNFAVHDPENGGDHERVLNCSGTGIVPCLFWESLFDADEPRVLIRSSDYFFCGEDA